jgi:hypothetical protein
MSNQRMACCRLCGTAMPNSYAEIRLRGRVALLRRRAIPAHGLGVALPDAFGHEVLVADLQLRARIAVLGESEEHARGAREIVRAIEPHAFVEVAVGRRRRARRGADSNRARALGRDPA